MTKPVYIVDLFEEIVSKLSTKMLVSLQTIDSKITGIHYLYGHYNEIQRRLLEKSETKSLKFSKYPLIALFQDFTIKKGIQNLGFYGEANLQFIILYNTQADAYSEDRMKDVFKPILYPIYHEFINQIAKSGKFNLYSDKTISHEQIDRPHWGDPGIYGNKGYIFTDVLDGIELRNVLLKTDLKIC